MRRALDRTWYPFFARFPQPTEVQLEAWGPLLAGHDCLVTAATATGKTEAVVAPLLERHLPLLSSRRPGLLLVCPTRALVNDLFRRLERPLARLGLRLHRRTGDHPTLPRRGAQVLVTTPESLDSLIVRHTRFLGAVRAALLDELHILDAGTRGDQLAMLMARLRSLRRGRLQCAVTSATIHDPDGIAGRYLRSARQVRVDRPPRLDTRWEHCPRRDDLLALLRSIWGGGAGGARKVLVFVDRRADVEI